MHSTIAATTLVKTFTRKPIPPKAAARFAVRAFRALLRFPIRTVRKQQAVVTLATIEPSRVRIDTSEREEISGTDGGGWPAQQLPAHWLQGIVDMSVARPDRRRVCHRPLRRDFQLREGVQRVGNAFRFSSG